MWFVHLNQRLHYTETIQVYNSYNGISSFTIAIFNHFLFNIPYSDLFFLKWLIAQWESHIGSEYT